MPAAWSAQPGGTYHSSVITSVATEAKDSSEPLLYAGLRLLQIGSQSSESSAPPRPPLAAQSVAPGDAQGSEDLSRALRELAALRERLHQAEVAEAMQAVKIIEIASEGMAIHAATTTTSDTRPSMLTSINESPWPHRPRDCTSRPS